MILAIIAIKRSGASRAYSRHSVRRTVFRRGYSRYEFDLWRLTDIFATAIALVGMAAIAVLAMHVFN